MKTYHIHIGGLVQGVGFRPHVYRIAEKYDLTGWVSNTNDGVHVEFNSTDILAHLIYSDIIHNAPKNSIITSKNIKEITKKIFSGFSIRTKSDPAKPDLLLTPDFNICDDCRKELFDKKNRRYQYPFTTCLQCGPRYSIATGLPYERKNTTMSPLVMCPDCKKEYNDVHNWRHFSQTNSCPNCTIPMQLFDADGKLIENESAIILEKLNIFLNEGTIAAVKGIGGYLLLCDAGNESVIQLLRRRKHRPSKPFALLYADLEMANEDVHLSHSAIAALKDKSGPIALCPIKTSAEKRICTSAIAPGLDKIGLMLPGSPLLQLIASAFGKPLIATSANISGSPIIYKDEHALEMLSGIADYIISYYREITQPQDDSVIQFTSQGQRIIIRRSRGMAPNYFPNPFENINACLLAMGGELKSAFALQDGQQLYISQYLGNQESFTSQTSFVNTLHHLEELLQINPSLILTDKHPGYFVSQVGNELASIKNIPLVTVQHHKAHFGAVLAENNLLNVTEPVLGVIWDGTGYGDDKQIWGSEFFIYDNQEMHRIAHLNYFSQLLGDKMSREPRLSALSILQSMPSGQSLIQSHFSEKEWQYYQQVIKQPASLLTSSMGRFIDGIASLLGICDINTYEGEAAMKMEALARSYPYQLNECYSLPLKNGRIDFTVLLQEMVNDINEKKPKSLIAKKVLYSLALCIGRISEYFNIKQVAFSGGIFQNALLTNMLNELYSDNLKLYWHRQLSPNDECIGFGQLACYHSIIKNNKPFVKVSESMNMVD